MKHFRPVTDGYPDTSIDPRQVVANPEQYHDRPLLRRFAWAALMKDRGQTVDQTRLAQMPIEAAQ